MSLQSGMRGSKLIGYKQIYSLKLNKVNLFTGRNYHYFPGKPENASALKPVPKTVLAE